jgi:putative transposase
VARLTATEVASAGGDPADGDNRRLSQDVRLSYGKVKLLIMSHSERVTTTRSRESLCRWAYVHGVSTRKVDDLVKALGGAGGVSKSEVSRICAELDGDLEAFRTRALEGEFPYVFADATCVKARVRGRVVSRAVVVATGVRADGTREVLGIDIGDSEAGAFWTAFFRSLRARGLSGVALVISDHHAGLKAAIAAVFVGASWQRCRVHFVRNALAQVPRGSNEMVAAAIRTIFAQPDAAHVRSQLNEIVAMLRVQFPDVAVMLADAADDLLAFTHFPQAHWRDAC